MTKPIAALAVLVVAIIGSPLLRYAWDRATIPTYEARPLGQELWSRMYYKRVYQRNYSKLALQCAGEPEQRMVMLDDYKLKPKAVDILRERYPQCGVRQLNCTFYGADRDTLCDGAFR